MELVLSPLTGLILWPNLPLSVSNRSENVSFCKNNVNFLFAQVNYLCSYPLTPGNPRLILFDCMYSISNLNPTPANELKISVLLICLTPNLTLV